MDTTEDLTQGTSVLKRLSMNTRLSAARIFDEESNDSTKSAEKSESKSTGKMKTKKKDFKPSPYKNNTRKRKLECELETDPIVLERRQKQIDYGKNTIGYDNYLQKMPKHKRNKDDPKTPEKILRYSRRGWDGLIRTWRQKLHLYDPEVTTQHENKEVKQELDTKNLIDFI